MLWRNAFLPKAWLERLNITEHGHRPALLDREGVLATLVHPMTEPGNQAYLDLAPHDCSAWVPAMGSQWHLHTIGTDH